MKSSVVLLSLGAALATPHYTIPSINDGAAWENVRMTENFQSNGPVEDVTSPQMTCYELGDGGDNVTTLDIQAGSDVTFNIPTGIFHQGPFSAWLAKAPDGETAASYDGSGANWFKIYQDYPTVADDGLKWPAQNTQSVSVHIPECVEDGEYLLRAEHIALHMAQSVGGAQFYLSCAQVSISGGSGMSSPELVSIPGVYDASDPGLHVNIYYPVPTDYYPPGPDPLECSC